MASLFYSQESYIVSILKNIDSQISAIQSKMDIQYQQLKHFTVKDLYMSQEIIKITELAEGNLIALLSKMVQWKWI